MNTTQNESLGDCRELITTGYLIDETIKKALSQQKKTQRYRLPGTVHDGFINQRKM